MLNIQLAAADNRKNRLYTGSMIDTIVHRWLKVPYTLHVRYVQRPRGAKKTLLFIHGLGTTGEIWDDVIHRLPPDIRIITIDLLGFGNSPIPPWAVYDARTQARAVLTTIVRLRMRTPLTVVGHSMGALVGIEMAKRYPLIINGLILCSPPLYSDKKTKLPRSETVLKRLYEAATQHPAHFKRLADTTRRYKLVRGPYNLSNEHMDSYMAALSAMIVRQTSLDDAYSLRVPTTIIRGTLDPLVVKKNYTDLAKSNPAITLRSVLAGHNIYGRFVPAVVKAVTEHLH